MHSGSKRVALACLLLALGVLAAGCGGSGGEEGEDVTATKGDKGLISWPYFGRVPERTHYLPAEGDTARPAAAAGLVRSTRTR